MLEAGAISVASAGWILSLTVVTSFTFVFVIVGCACCKCHRKRKNQEEEAPYGLPATGVVTLNYHARQSPYKPVATESQVPASIPLDPLRGTRTQPLLHDTTKYTGSTTITTHNTAGALHNIPSATAAQNRASLNRALPSLPDDPSTSIYGERDIRHQPSVHKPPSSLQRGHSHTSQGSGISLTRDSSISDLYASVDKPMSPGHYGNYNTNPSVYNRPPYTTTTHDYTDGTAQRPFGGAGPTGFQQKNGAAGGSKNGSSTVVNMTPGREINEGSPAHFYSQIRDKNPTFNQSSTSTAYGGKRETLIDDHYTPVDKPSTTPLSENSSTSPSKTVAPGSFKGSTTTTTLSQNVRVTTTSTDKHQYEYPVFKGRQTQGDTADGAQALGTAKASHVHAAGRDAHGQAIYVASGSEDPYASIASQRGGLNQGGGGEYNTSTLSSNDDPWYAKVSDVRATQATAGDRSNNQAGQSAAADNLYTKIHRNSQNQLEENIYGGRDSLSEAPAQSSATTSSMPFTNNNKPDSAHLPARLPTPPSSDQPLVHRVGEHHSQVPAVPTDAYIHEGMAPDSTPPDSPPRGQAAGGHRTNLPKREPSYRYITVRESLDVLRERMAAQARSQEQQPWQSDAHVHYYSTIDTENAYETVAGNETPQHLYEDINQLTGGVRPHNQSQSTNNNAPTNHNTAPANQHRELLDNNSNIEQDVDSGYAYVSNERQVVVTPDNRRNDSNANHGGGESRNRVQDRDQNQSISINQGGDRSSSLQKQDENSPPRPPTSPIPERDRVGFGATDRTSTTIGSHSDTANQSSKTSQSAISSEAETRTGNTDVLDLYTAIKPNAADRNKSLHSSFDHQSSSDQYETANNSQDELKSIDLERDIGNQQNRYRTNNEEEVAYSTADEGKTGKETNQSAADQYDPDRNRYSANQSMDSSGGDQSTQLGDSSKMDRSLSLSDQDNSDEPVGVDSANAASAAANREVNRRKEDGYDVIDDRWQTETQPGSRPRFLISEPKKPSGKPAPPINAITSETWTGKKVTRPGQAGTEWKEKTPDSNISKSTVDSKDQYRPTMYNSPNPKQTQSAPKKEEQFPTGQSTKMNRSPPSSAFGDRDRAESDRFNQQAREHKQQLRDDLRTWTPDSPRHHSPSHLVGSLSDWSNKPRQAHSMSTSPQRNYKDVKSVIDTGRHGTLSPQKHSSPTRRVPSPLRASSRTAFGSNSAMYESAYKQPPEGLISKESLSIEIHGRKPNSPDSFFSSVRSSEFNSPSRSSNPSTPLTSIRSNQSATSGFGGSSICTTPKRSITSESIPNQPAQLFSGPNRVDTNPIIDPAVNRLGDQDSQKQKDFAMGVGKRPETTVFGQSGYGSNEPIIQTPPQSPRPKAEPAADYIDRMELYARCEQKVKNGKSAGDGGAAGACYCHQGGGAEGKEGSEAVDLESVLTHNIYQMNNAQLVAFS